MSTVLELSKQPPAKPLAAATMAWRQSIIDGEFDEAVAAAADCTESEWRNRRRLYVDRCEAKRVLDEVVPKLQQGVDKAAKALADARGFASTAIPDATTFADFRARIAAIVPGVPMQTPAEISRALQHSMADGPRCGGIGRLKSSLSDLRASLDTTRQAAEQLLQTTAGLGDNLEFQRIQEKIAALRKRIQSRDAILRAEEEAKRQRQFIENVVSGKAIPPDRSAVGLRRFLSVQKSKLKELVGMSVTAAEVRGLNVSDEAEIERLQAESAAASEAYRQRLLQPESMAFTLD